MNQWIILRQLFKSMKEINYFAEKAICVGKSFVRRNEAGYIRQRSTADWTLMPPNMHGYRLSYKQFVENKTTHSINCLLNIKHEKTQVTKTLY